MSTVVEIQEAIERLSPRDRTALAAWLESQQQPRMSKDEEAALHEALDKAACELDAGIGVPIEEVRGLVAKWATR